MSPWFGFSTVTHRQISKYIFEMGKNPFQMKMKLQNLSFQFETFRRVFGLHTIGTLPLSLWPMSFCVCM